MKRTRKAAAGLAAAVALVAAAPASRGSNLEEQLAVLSGGDKPQAGAKSGWVQMGPKADGGGSCAMSYRDGINSIGYIGPSKSWDESYFYVTGPSIPRTSKTRSVRVRLATDGDADQTVRAFHYMISSNKWAILFKLTDFSAALDAMEDVEDIAIVLMEPDDPQYQQAIFTGRWVGGHTAREKLRACLARTG
jgi:hypothetical protein